MANRQKRGPCADGAVPLSSATMTYAQLRDALRRGQHVDPQEALKLAVEEVDRISRKLEDAERRLRLVEQNSP